jgi:hypothetical protein
MQKNKRAEQLLALRDRLAKEHEALRFEQAGIVGQLVRKYRARVERVWERVTKRIAVLVA